jgi:pyridoxal 5'-phosphate synthase pdxT subunit
VTATAAGARATSRVGVLALQGDFAAHARALAAAGLAPVEVRAAADLAPAAGLAGLVLPGGESTTMLNLIDRFALGPALDAFVRGGAPVLATCAGLILASRAVREPTQRSFGWLDVTVARNAWGRQRDSFEARSDDGAHALVFIRAPRILDVGPDVEIQATFQGEPVMVRKGNVTGATFHPELTGDARVHARVFGSA